MSWPTKPEAREELLAAVVTLGPTRATAGTIARHVKKSPATVLQMLYALKADGVVSYEHIKRVMHWRATGVPIPVRSAPTCQGRAALGPYDHHSLAAALGVPAVPPRPLGEPSTIHILRGGYATET